MTDFPKPPQIPLDKQLRTLTENTRKLLEAEKKIEEVSNGTRKPGSVPPVKK